MARGYEMFASCALALGAQAAVGCTDDGVTMHVVCTIPPEVEEGNCTFDSASETCVLNGVMNLLATQTYTQFVAVESGLKPRVRDVPPQGETNGAQVTGARVELRTPAGARIGNLSYLGGADGATAISVPNPFNVVASGYVPPGGRAAVGVVMITPAHAAALAQSGAEQIVAAVQLLGKTDGEVEFESGEFSWPIRLISASPSRADNQCIVIEEVCGSLLGQDGFALACLGQ